MPCGRWQYPSRLAQSLCGERSRYHINNDTSPASHVNIFSLRMRYTRVSILCHDVMPVCPYCVLHKVCLCYGFGKSRFVTIPIVLCSVSLFGLPSCIPNPPTASEQKIRAFFPYVQSREQKTPSRYKYRYLLLSNQPNQSPGWFQTRAPTVRISYILTSPTACLPTPKQP
jgi:hypothetical protein